MSFPVYKYNEWKNKNIINLVQKEIPPVMSGTVTLEPLRIDNNNFTYVKTNYDKDTGKSLPVTSGTITLEQFEDQRDKLQINLDKVNKIIDDLKALKALKVLK